MKKTLIILFLLLSGANGYGQGYNHQWLLGSYNFFQDPKGRILFDSGSYSLINENRKMVFKGTQANISDVNGNLLMASNGIWIANATGDTMMNGGGLNPGGITSNWPNGLPMTANNIFLSFSNDTNKFMLFHHTANFDGYSYPTNHIYLSEIDISLDNGKGSVTNKNQIILSDTLNWGLAACKHANGSDWWVIITKHNTDSTFIVNTSSTGIQYISSQKLNVPKSWYGVIQPVFSNSGNQFAYFVYDSSTVNSTVLLFDFNRCNGTFSNPKIIPTTFGELIWGLAFSPSGKYIYACSSSSIFQIDTDNLSVDTVATYDGFVSPVGSSCCATTFWNMYLAANGKIYVTSGSGVQHIHEINYPDSAGIACDVQQHAIDLGYAQLRSVPNHPNYYLGCDTTLGCPCLTTGIEEHGSHEFRFNVAPNPNSGKFKITYLLPQNHPGQLEVFDINGRRIYEMNLPPWSTMQEVLLPKSISSGVYNCVITSGGERGNKKVVVYKE
ncbi:MAG: T9SS type A sorting domain-containing protein [Bacteroidetes bacterium]|nr:T9SS type A sorting domain-containing protein [Bacteroidota bacterium]